MRTCGLLLVVIGLVLLVPDTAWAFGPATHVYLGSRLLDTLVLLPGALATLIRTHPMSFLYGSVAADISLAKKYAPAGRHCHYWHVGEEIYAEAENDRLRAVGLGYLSHLAADTVAHNFFVPRQLLLTSSTRALGHSYWEARLDAHLGEAYSTLARKVVMDYDHTEADLLFDRVLSGTIFSFQTNRRIFRGMIRFQDNERWQMVFGRMVEKSRWDLAADAVETYRGLAFDFMVDYLLHRRDAVAATLDPTGRSSLSLAKKVRRAAIREGAWWDAQLLRELANDFFPLPAVNFRYWLTDGSGGALESESPV